MKVLVLGGGGSRGAMQVGWLRHRTATGSSWDTVYGTSVGAINALHLGHYEPSQHARGAEDLEARWISLRGTGDVLGGRALGVLGAASQGSLYTTEPLAARLRQWYRPAEFERTPVTVGVVSVGRGLHELRRLSKAMSPGDPVKWVLASASFPLAMPPVPIGSESYRDGGVRRICPVLEALAIPGATEIDAVSCSPLRSAPHAVDAFGLKAPFHDILRVVELMAAEVGESDYAAAYARWLAMPPGSRPVVRWWWPTQAPIADPMSFEPSDIARSIGAGVDVARGGPRETWA